MQWSGAKAILKSLGVPGYADENPYNVINYAFWLSSGAVDTALGWENILDYSWDAKYPDCNDPGLCFNSSAQMRAAILDKFHSAGKSLVLSAFGATEFPTTEGRNPTTTCAELGDYAKRMGYDGVDLDWEDNAAMEGGTGEEWLITCTKVLRQKLPKGKYLLTSAPQAPYFVGSPRFYPNGGYLKYDKEVGDLTDFYNVQFYNQGDTTYDTYEKLFVSSGGPFAGTAIQEIADKGVDMKRLVVGKPVLTKDAANTGWMSANDLKSAVARARTELNWNAGIMTWQYESDANRGFSFVNAVAEAF